MIPLRTRIRAFVVKSIGVVTSPDLISFEELLQRRNVPYSEKQLKNEIEDERILIERSGATLFVCESGPCRKEAAFYENSIEINRQHFPFKIEMTICQWGCDRAPVATLYKENKWTRFEQFNVKEVLSGNKS
jgi:hypothetical protein